MSKKFAVLLMVILVYSGLIETGCKPEKTDPTPTIVETIKATGGFLPEDISDPNALEITFKPGGGSLKGSGTIDEDGTIWTVKLRGQSNAEGSASGTMTLTHENALFQFDWKAEISEGKIEGQYSDGDATYRFLLTY